MESNASFVKLTCQAMYRSTQPNPACGVGKLEIASIPPKGKDHAKNGEGGFLPISGLFRTLDTGARRVKGRFWAFRRFAAEKLSVGRQRAFWGLKTF